MKRFIYILLGLISILVVAALVVPFLIPSEVYKNQIEKAATNALNRDVALNGDVKISVFPRISASVENVTVSNPEGFEGDHMITAGALRGSVKWMPLLSQRVDVQELAFIDANVGLQRLADGRANWDFSNGEPAPTPDPDKKNGSVDAAIAAARLKNATLTYSDAVSGANYELKELDLEASLLALDKPFEAKGSGLFQNQKFDLSLTLDSPEAATAGQPANANFSLQSSLGNASYDGSLVGGEAPALDGAFSVTSDDLAQMLKFAGISPPLDVAQLGKVAAKGKVSGPASALTISIDEATQSSDLANTRFSGRIAMGDAPTIDGDLEFDAASLAAVTKFANIEAPINLTPLGAATVKATLKGALTQPTISLQTARLKSDKLDASYTGAVTLGSTPRLDGALKAIIPDASDLVSALGVDMPTAGGLDAVDLSAQLAGPVDAIALSKVAIKHSGDLLNANFNGALSMKGNGAIDGDIAASSNQLRAFLAASQIELAPGETLQSFDLKTNLKGSFKAIAMDALSLKLDDINGTGSGRVDLTGARPKLAANLDMGAVDLSPFLGKPDPNKPKSTNSGWSKTPLDLAGLKAVDADIKLTTSALTVGDVKLTDAAVDAGLAGGRLTADLPKFKVFGGNWNGKLIVNAQEATPILSFNMKGDSVAMSSLLGTMAGFDKLSGTGEFEVVARSSGMSIHDIMTGLDGSVSTNLNNGALKGINVGQLVRSASSLKDAVATGTLQSLDFSNVMSAAAETDFTNFKTVLKVENGVAKVDLMKLINPVLGVDGAGEINIGGQSLDLRLATSIDQKGQADGAVVQLNGIPVPVRISGNWTSLKLSPDLSGVQTALRQELEGQVRDEINTRLGDEIDGRLGGVAGGVLGDVLGVKKPEDTAPEETPSDASQPSTPDGTEPETSETNPETPAEPEPEPETLEEAAEDAVKDAIGGLFKRD